MSERFVIFKQLFCLLAARGGDKHDSPAVWQLHQILAGISTGEDLEGESPWQWGGKWKQAAFQVKHLFLMWIELWQKKKENQINYAPAYVQEE